MSNKLIVIYISLGLVLLSLILKYGIEAVCVFAGISNAWLFRIREREKNVIGKV